MLVGLNGFKGSGKDTVGQYLVERYMFERRSFMDKMKESAAALFDIDPKMWDYWKDDDGCVVQIIQTDVQNHKGFLTDKITVRNFLQRYGSEAHRDIFGQNFWIDHTLKGIDPTAMTVITDARLGNELAAIKRYGEGDSINVRIVRDGLKPDGHSTEVEPPPYLIDYTIENNGTIEELAAKVDGFMNWVDGQWLVDEEYELHGA